MTVSSAAADAPDAVVLVVDDVAMFRELEVLFLSRFGRVVPVASAVEALAFLRRETPDVVVLDQGLPDAPAETVMRALREAAATRDVPVIAVTGGRAREHERAVRTGAVDVVAKPLTRRVLIGSVRRFLRNPDVRGLPRVPVDAPVHLWNARRETWGVARNLSRGGMFIESGWLPPAETEVHLDFRLPEGSSPLSPTARLVWRRLRPVDGAPGMGVRFLALDGAAARHLDAFVHERGDGERDRLGESAGRRASDS